MTDEPIPELLSQYRTAAAIHYEASAIGDSQRANRQADIVDSIFDQIRERGAAGRGALLTLVDDQNDAVALMAAIHSIAAFPDRCLKRIKRVAKSKELIGFMARQSLERWKEGNLNFG